MKTSNTVSIRALLMAAIAASMGLMAAGCKDNPYPNGQYTENRPARQIVEKAYVIDAPDTVDFSEGSEGSFTIRGIVPAPGQASISIEGLPAGATYNPAQNLFTWTPGYNAADDPAHPKDNVRLYHIVATVHSSADNKGTTQKTITLAVHDTPQSYKLVSFADRASMYEGTPYTALVTIEDLDAPKGPFLVTGNNLPAGATLTVDPMNPAVYTINYTPDYDVVDSNQYGSKDLSWSLLVIDPKGRSITVPVVWSVSDTRLDPAYSGPQNLTTKVADVDFVFIAQDPNLEVEPTVTASSVAIGTLDVSRLNGGGPTRGKRGAAPYQMLHVHWSNIPATEAGKSEALNFNMCVFDRYHRMTQCKNQQVTINFTLTVAPQTAPQALTLLDSVSDLKSSPNRVSTIYGGSL